MCVENRSTEGGNFLFGGRRRRCNVWITRIQHTVGSERLIQLPLPRCVRFLITDTLKSFRWNGERGCASGRYVLGDDMFSAWFATRTGIAIDTVQMPVVSCRYIIIYNLNSIIFRLGSVLGGNDPVWYYQVKLGSLLLTEQGVDVYRNMLSIS